MSALKNTAASVPAEFRKQMLEENWISKAKPNKDDSYMKKLFVLYYTYIAPDESFDKDLTTRIPLLTCPICIDRYYSTFRSLLPYFVQLEKEHNTIEQI